jgi:hypothetical protein
MSNHNITTAQAAAAGPNTHSHTHLPSARPSGHPMRLVRPAWLGPKKLAAGALIGTAILVSLPSPMAQAGPVPVTISLSSDVFPTGGAVPGGMSGTIPVSTGASVTLTASQYLYQPATSPATSPTVYEFMFWDVNSRAITTSTATFTVSGGAATIGASAWYVPICVVASSCSGGASSVTTWAFSLTSDSVLPGTPIGSVTPASAWTSPSTSVSTATAVNIVALPYLGVHNKFGGTAFRSWFAFGGASTIIVSGGDMQVPAGESHYAVAFYTHYSGPTPPICVGYPHCL